MGGSRLLLSSDSSSDSGFDYIMLILPLIGMFVIGAIVFLLIWRYYVKRHNEDALAAEETDFQSMPSSAPPRRQRRPSAADYLVSPPTSNHSSERYRPTAPPFPTTSKVSTTKSSRPTVDRVTSSSTRNPKTGAMECGICIEPMGGGASRMIAVPPCGHAYCHECLVTIVRQYGGKCPQCKRGFTENQITTVYG